VATDKETGVSGLPSSLLPPPSSLTSSLPSRVLSVIKHWVQHWPDMLLFDEAYTKTLLHFSKHAKGDRELEKKGIEDLVEVVNTQIKRNVDRKQV
jgi:hypothetical protein